MIYHIKGADTMRFYLVFNVHKQRYYIIDMKSSPTLQQQEQYIVDQTTGIYKSIIESSNDYVEIMNILIEKQFDLIEKGLR